VFLFGGQKVYRHFSQDKNLGGETFTAEYSTCCDHLLVLAYLLGSNHVEGAEGVGMISAMETSQERDSQI